MNKDNKIEINDGRIEGKFYSFKELMLYISTLKFNPDLKTAELKLEDCEVMFYYCHTNLSDSEHWNLLVKEK